MAKLTIEFSLDEAKFFEALAMTLKALTDFNVLRNLEREK